jgi:hypothetical protein
MQSPAARPELIELEVNPQTHLAPKSFQLRRCRIRGAVRNSRVRMNGHHGDSANREGEGQSAITGCGRTVITVAVPAQSAKANVARTMIFFMVLFYGR